MQHCPDVRRVLGLAAVAVLSGCGPATGGGGVPDAGSQPWWHAELSDCSSFQSKPWPRTVLQMVERINALPHPVTVECVVASLPRPLPLVATTSIISLQPAASRHDPRVFIVTDTLIFSVVSAGEGRPLMEFGEVVEPGRTLKGELLFPVEGALGDDAPLKRVLPPGNTQTNCGLCHRAEAPHPSLPGGFVSAAFKPEGSSLVPLGELQRELADCDPKASHERCVLLQALLGLGATRAGAFPTSFELMLQ